MNVKADQITGEAKAVRLAIGNARRRFAPSGLMGAHGHVHAADQRAFQRDHVTGLTGPTPAQVPV